MEEQLLPGRTTEEGDRGSGIHWMQRENSAGFCSSIAVLFYDLTQFIHQILT